MRLSPHREAARRAEARAVQARARCAAQWRALQDEGAAAATPGRVLLAGLVSGCLAERLAGAPRRCRAPAAARRMPLWPDLVRSLLPALVPAIRAGLGAARRAADPPA